MACSKNGLGGHSHSSIMVPVNKNATRETCHNMPLLCLKCMQKEDEDDTEFWARPRVPLRPPFTVPRPGARILENPRALRRPFSLAPAIEKQFLAIEVNSTEGLENQSKKEQDSINISQEISGNSMAMITGGPRVGSGVNEGNGNSSKPYMPVPRSQGFVPSRASRGPQLWGPPSAPTLRSGIMMEETTGNDRMPYNGSLDHGFFPPGSPRHPMNNWQQRPPLHFPHSIPGSPCSTANGFMPPQPPAFNLFPVMPSPFSCPLSFGPPLMPFLFLFNIGAMYPPGYSN